MKLFVREGGCVSQRLLDVFRIEVWILFQDLGGGHSVRDQIDQQGHGDAHSTDARTSTHDVLGECDPVKRVQAVHLLTRVYQGWRVAMQDRDHASFPGE